MAEFVLPSYVELPKVEIVKTGDFRKDLAEMLSKMTQHFDEQAQFSAMRQVLGYVGPKQGRPVYEDAHWPAVAASVLRQVNQLVEGTTELAMTLL